MKCGGRPAVTLLVHRDGYIRAHERAAGAGRATVVVIRDANLGRMVPRLVQTRGDREHLFRAEGHAQAAPFAAFPIDRHRAHARILQHIGARRPRSRDGARRLLHGSALLPIQRRQYPNPETVGKVERSVDREVDMVMPYLSPASLESVRAPRAWNRPPILKEAGTHRDINPSARPLRCHLSQTVNDYRPTTIMSEVYLPS
jgi:hypothetical protein